MMNAFSRRGLVAALCACVALPALAAEPKTAPLGKAFPFLESYLKLPPAERTRFTLAYRLTSGGEPVSGVRAWVLYGTSRAPLSVGPDGRLGPLPNVAQLHDGKLQIDVPASRKFGVDMSVEPSAAPAAELDAADLNQAVAQAAAGSKKAAGLMGFVVPAMERGRFVGAAGGEAVYPDGRRSALPIFHGEPVYDPAAWHGVKTLRFARAPQRMMIGPAK